MAKQACTGPCRGQSKQEDEGAEGKQEALRKQECRWLCRM